MIRFLLAVLMLAGATAALADNPPEATFCPRITYAFDPASNNVQLHADAISNPRFNRNRASPVGVVGL